MSKFKNFLALAGICGFVGALNTVWILGGFEASAASAPEKASQCTGCHGAEGRSSMEIYPNLAGQKKAYLVKQLKDFRSKERTDPYMTGIAAGLSDADIDVLSAYFSSIKP
jgi:cytochrome c553